MAGEQQDEIIVLHVDDEPDFAEMAAEFLEREDDRFSVRTVTSAAAGLDHLEESVVDCVVADYNMPGMNGIELLEAVREDHEDLPFILYTGKGSEEVASRAISAGVTDYLQKDHGTEQYSLLANRIENAVEQVRANKRATEQHRINEVVRTVNEALVSATSHEEIDEQVCEILSTADPYRFAWIGEHDPETGTVEPRAASGIGDDYLDRIEVTVDNSPTGKGPTGRAIRGHELAVMQNIPETSEFEPWREYALEQGYRSSAAVPLEYEDTLYGVLNVYADRTQAFDEPERQLLSDLGETIAHAYHRIDLQRQYTEQYRTLFEEAPVMVVFTEATDAGPIIEDCNSAFADRLGYTREELQGKPLGTIYSQAAGEKLETGDGYLRALEGDFTREQRTLVTSEGEEVLTILRAAPRRNTDGDIVGTHALYLDITDERQIQELERMTDLFEQAQEIANLGAWETDLQEGEGWWTEEVNRIYGLPEGYQPDPGEGIEYFHPEDQPKISEAFERATETGEPYDLELRVVDESGTQKWVRARADPQVADGEVVRVRGTLQDITESKEREEEIKRSNAVLSTLFDTLPEGVLAEDENREVLAVNKQLFDLLDLPGAPEDAAGSDCEQLAETVSESFTDPDEFLSRINTLVAEREPVDNEELTLADGRTFERSYRPIDVQELQGHLWVYRDITERRERQREVETVLERMNDAVFVHGEDGRFMFVNQTVLDRYGYDEEELYEMTPEDIAVPGATEQMHQRVSRLMDVDELVFETEHQVASGETFPVEVSATSITFRGEPAILGIVRDISQRKDQERKLRRQIERLDEFASVVSHDLRNPLNVAQGRIALARETHDSTDLESAANAVDRALNLIEDMLTLARAGEQASEMEPVDIVDLVDSCWAQVETARATIDVDEDLVIRADRSRLRQLLENLFRNAVEHGGEEVTVTVGALPDGFYVADDGPGIAETHREDVFEAGYSRSEHGSGFGLSIVKQIVEAHGWEIRVTESDDGGAQFEITGVEFPDR